MARSLSSASSYHTQTVDDTLIQNQKYVYRGGGHETERYDERIWVKAFKTVISPARGTGPFGFPLVTISSCSTLGKNIFVTSPPSIGWVTSSDRDREVGRFKWTIL